MPGAKHITSPTLYASTGDFDRIFHEQKDSLYRLSFLLTADHVKAQQCFVSGLVDSVKGNPVFKEWARSWARRTIIHSAVRVINPRPTEKHDRVSFDRNRRTEAIERGEIGAVLELEPFERFVFVMLVLEHYSEQECSLLLSCSPRDVIAGRNRALQQLRDAMELHVNQQESVGSEMLGSHDNYGSALEDVLHV
jgi:DNA-directed RNA polymerase specialized sigma24 family protein